MNAIFPTFRSGDEGEIDLGVAGSVCAFDCSAESYWSFQVFCRGTDTWPASGVVTVRVSNDGINWTTVGSAVTLSAVGMTTAVDVRAVRFISLVVTTAGSSSVIARVFGYGKWLAA